MSEMLNRIYGIGRILCVLAVAAAGTAAFGDGEIPSENLALGSAGAMMIGSGVYGAPANYYPIGEAINASGNSNDGVTGGGTVKYSLKNATGGELVSQEDCDFHIGDFCSKLPVDDPDEIDWNATYVSITNSEAYAKGMIAYIESSTNVCSRILFTRGGESGVKITWVYSQLGRERHSGNVGVEISYRIGAFSSNRPHRLYWTSAPYNAPSISLSGKFIRLMGDPALITPKYGAVTSAGTSNVVQGVYYDSSSQTLQALAEKKDDDTYEGPNGEFVLAYYRDGDRDDFICAIVVQVMSGTKTPITACVGDELRPMGGGWDTEGLKPVIQSGLSDNMDDKSPYIEQGTYLDNSGYELDLIHAIVPTAGDNAQGSQESTKVDIIWEAPDTVGTLWPFEEDIYQIDWDAKMPKVAIGSSQVGLSIHLPTNFVSEVCAFQLADGDTKASKFVTIANYEATVTKAGKFTIKFTNQDQNKVWYQSFRALASDSKLMKGDFTPVVPVGRELRPLAMALGGSASNQYAQIDETLSGYIYVPNSQGRNWNTVLYHEPDAALQTVAMQETITFDDLESAIYPVSASDDSIEVWWRGSRAPNSPHFGQLDKITFPTAVTDYKIEEVKANEVHHLILASQLGSAGAGGKASSGALVMKDSATALDTPSERTISVGTNGFAMSMWINPQPGSVNAKLATGTIASAQFAEGSVSFAVDTTNAKRFVCTVSTENGTASSARFDLTNDCWTSVVFTRNCREWQLIVGDEVISTNAMPWETLSSGLYFQIGNGISAASGLAVDEIRIWQREVDVDELKEYWTSDFASGEYASDAVCYWTFDRDEVRDEASGITVENLSNAIWPLVSNGACELLPNGAPRSDDGLVYAADGVEPEVYRQNDDGGIGYHPNYNHAFARLQTEDGGYVTWAIRNDLGGDDIVFTMYNDGGKCAMATYLVNDLETPYNEFLIKGTAGLQMLPPKPLCFLDDYWSSRTSYTALVPNGKPAEPNNFIVYRDRKGQDWARCAGAASAFYHYKCRNTFDAPNDVTLTADTVLPWMSCLDGDVSDVQILMGQPADWTWKCEWPSEDEVPTMCVAETLTKSKNGLPEVWNMNSCAVVYPTPTVTLDDFSTTEATTNGVTKISYKNEFSDGKVTNYYPIAKWNKMSSYKKNKNLIELRYDIVTRQDWATTNWQMKTAVDLVDPTVARTAGLAIPTSLEKDYGFTVGNSGTCRNKSGKWYFSDLPPSIADRFYIDANATQDKNMVLIGNLVEPAAGNAYLQLNVLTDDERQALREICKGSDDAKKKWIAAVNQLALDVVEPNQPTMSQSESMQAVYVPYEFRTNYGVTSTLWLKPGYSAADHYALMANGSTDGWVALIENDWDDEKYVNDGDPISMKLIRVKPKLYNGTICTLTDPLNKLSEKLTVQYNEPFGNAATNFVFQWRRRDAAADGSLPTDYDNDESWPVYRETTGLSSFLIGTNGTTLAELVNKYYVMRYRAKEGTLAAETVGTDWSDFTEVTLAEGWVQRVLNAVTPFSQRIEDFYSNPSDIWYTMFEQIGKPYTGDVALNNDNLTEVGLIELYQTVLNKAEKMSLAMGVEDASVNKQLLLAASRLADLYILLGAEAYSDAKNPLISQGLSSEYLSELALLPSTTFCFQNQVSTLLDEELALLRGRSYAVSFPNMTTQPYFNRLIWNFTKGVTEGEVAYVNNYGIRGTDGLITADSAAAQYPQGHGDAWGHYLSAIKGYYHLLRNEYFGWTPSMMEMLVSQAVVNEDYTDEQKFADAAVKLVQTGIDAEDLTARKAWRDNGGEMTSAYTDGISHSYGTNIVVKEAFGYGEWASRSCKNALYNWAAINSILPTNSEPAAVYSDRGISQITRTTATQLKELGNLYKQAEQKANNLDSGLNPLGLSQNAVPMDIDPTALESKNSHFEQILERAEKALANCETVLEYANQYGARLQKIQNAESEDISEQAAMEADFTKRLIAIYGKPYSGDIGPSGTYEQGYEGPDLYHYMYMDPEEYGLTAAEITGTNSTFEVNYYAYDYDKGSGDGPSNVVTSRTVKVAYTLLNNNLTVAPDDFGVRATEGSIQSAYRSYLTAFEAAKAAKIAYQFKVDYMNKLKQTYYDLYATKIFRSTESLAKTVTLAGLKTANYSVKHATTIASIYSAIANTELEDDVDALPDVQIVGLANSLPVRGVTKAAILPLISAMAATEAASQTTKTVSDYAYNMTELWWSTAEAMWDYGYGIAEAHYALAEKYVNLASAVSTAANALVAAYGDLATAEAQVRAAIESGETLQNEREAYRKRISNTATQYRYQDMYNRVQRNNALTKYSTAFDTAQRYVWELAKVYDYETGLLSGDSQAGDAFMAEIIGSRQLGYEGVSTSSATDKGLYDVVNRMKENWAVLEGRLGVNNPDEKTMEFSLRYELFRIRKDSEGDEKWKQELRKYVVSDLSKNEDFVRFCQPLQGADGNAAYGAGLVIPFATSIYTSQNFFGKTLQGGDHAFSSADYAVKLYSAGVGFTGYDKLAAEQSNLGLAANPNVYFVPVGRDYMRAPAGTSRKVLSWNVVDQVLPLPYTVGSTELDDEDWISTFQGLDGTTDSAAKIRRHSTLQMNYSPYSRRLTGRSVWNDKWMLVIPASELSDNQEKAIEKFIDGVSDIVLHLRTYSRSGN